MAEELATLEPAQASTPAPRLYPLRDLVDEAVAQAQALHEARTTGRPIGAQSGLPSLDRELNGAWPVGLNILHGQPGSGKTAFALQVAATCGCPALFVTCEMGAVELLRRIAARVTGEYLNRFRTGEFPPERARLLFEQAAASAPMLAILDGTKAPVRPADLLAFAETTRALAPENPYLLLVVDSVHSWARGWQAEAAEYDTLNAGLATLRELAQRLGAAILGIGERNRASKDGGLNATAGSRVFEYGSEALLSLDRAKEPRPGGFEYEVTLKFEKNRHGAPGREVRLLFHGALQKFTEDI